MGKILVFVAVLIIIYIVFFKNRKKKGEDEDKEAANFVECDKCGTFIETKNAVVSAGRYICNDCIKGGK